MEAATGQFPLLMPDGLRKKQKATKVCALRPRINKTEQDLPETPLLEKRLHLDTA
jgi:hypothetical protein